MDESTLTNSENDSFYSKDTLNTVSDTDIPEVDGFDYSLPKLISSISNVLMEIIQDNKLNVNPCYIKKDCFYSKRIPVMSLEDYLKRIVKYANVEISTLICSVMYIDKMCEKNNYILCFNNIHRLLLTAVVISSKFNEDSHYNNRYYAKIGGITIDEMNDLELLMCSYLDFKIFILPENYEKYDKFFRHCQSKQT